MTNKTPWIDPENAGLVALYFAMNDAAQSGKSYIKAAMIRAAQDSELRDIDYMGSLANRSRASIEFKLMNATAAHADILADIANEQRGEDRPQLAPDSFMDQTMHDHGYRAMPNYQASLKAAMSKAIAARTVVGWVADAAEARA